MPVYKQGYYKFDRRSEPEATLSIWSDANDYHAGLPAEHVETMTRQVCIGQREHAMDLVDQIQDADSDMNQEYRRY